APKQAFTGRPVGSEKTGRSLKLNPNWFAGPCRIVRSTVHPSCTVARIWVIFPIQSQIVSPSRKAPSGGGDLWNHTNQTHHSISHGRRSAGSAGAVRPNGERTKPLRISAGV